MEYYINDIIDDKYKSIMPEKLGNFIKSNYEEKKEFFEININPRYVYNMKDIHEYDNVRNIKLNFSNSGYNEDIVKAFEYAYIQNEENRQKFIKEQYNFIDKLLSIKERIILNDYTKKNSFALYTAYVTRSTDNDWFEKYKNENIGKAFCFGDSFFYQIWSVFKNAFYTKLKIDPNSLKAENSIEIFYKYWENQNYKRIKCFNLSLFYDFLFLSLNGYI